MDDSLINTAPNVSIAKSSDSTLDYSDSTVDSSEFRAMLAEAGSVQRASLTYPEIAVANQDTSIQSHFGNVKEELSSRISRIVASLNEENKRLMEDVAKINSAGKTPEQLQEETLQYGLDMAQYQVKCQIFTKFARGCITGVEQLTRPS